MNCDGLEIDLSALNGFSAGNAVELPAFTVEIGATNRTAVASSVYIDDLIVVEGEI